MNRRAYKSASALSFNALFKSCTLQDVKKQTHKALNKTLLTVFKTALSPLLLYYIYLATNY